MSLPLFQLFLFSCFLCPSSPSSAGVLSLSLSLPGLNLGSYACWSSTLPHSHISQLLPFLCFKYLFFNFKCLYVPGYILYHIVYNTCIYVGMHQVCAGARGGQNRASDHLESELQVIRSCHVCEDMTWVLCKSRKHS